MKRCICLVFVILLLAGCRNLYPDDYIYVESNQSPYAYRETTAPVTTLPVEAEVRTVTVSTLGDIRTGIQKLVKAGSTKGRFLLHEYRGDTSNLPETVRDHLLAYSPKYVYAMKSLDLSTEVSGDDLLLNVQFQPAMSPEEFDEITTCRYPDAFPLIYHALQEHLSSCTVEIIGYVKTDFKETLGNYILEHWLEITEVPEISVEIFPEKDGFIRVVKFQFDYETEQDALQWQQKSLDSLLETFQYSFRESDTPQQTLDALYMILVPASGYTSDDYATAYSLFSYKRGSSRMMSNVAAYFCDHAGKQCEIVVGERRVDPNEFISIETASEEENPEKEIWVPWYWNRILTEDRWLYFDLHSAALSGNKPQLLPCEEMTDYRWDAEQYPELELPSPTESTESEAPTEPEETEATEETAEPSPETP